MKILFLFALLLINFAGLAQNFVPFNEAQPKRFDHINDPSQNDYFFYVDSADTYADSTVFHQYFRVSTNTVVFDPTDCPTWGGFDGPVGDTTWLGREFIYMHSTATLKMKNKNTESLTFDFGLNLGDSALFYQNVIDEYYIKFTQAGQESILGQQDSVKTFTILHYDNVGTQIITPLDQFEIKLGENLGMIQFIDCNQFPQVEQGLKLKGQLHPTIGKYQMTYDEAYPWQIGDAVEYLGVYSQASFNINNQLYQYFTVNNRVETSDSVKIYFDVATLATEQPLGNGQGAPSMGLANPLVYKKGTNISEIPSNKMPTNHLPVLHDSADNCGMREVLTINEEWTYYCDSCDCLVPYDGFANPLEAKQWFSGLGQTKSKVTTYGPDVPYSNVSLIYATVSGDECGQIVYLGAPDYSDFEIGVYPNPTKGLVRIKSNAIISKVELIALNGQVLQTTFANEIDLSEFEQGFYFVKVETNKGTAVRRLIKN